MTGLFFSVFAASPPAVDADAVPAVMMWGYVGELIFNMLILVETVKMADRIVKEMMFSYLSNISYISSR